MQTFTCYSCGKDHPYTNESEIKTIIDNNETHQVCEPCVDGYQSKSGDRRITICIHTGKEVEQEYIEEEKSWLCLHNN